MKKCLICIFSVALMSLTTGCGWFGGGKTYDGSEAATEQLGHRYSAEPPAYMGGFENNDDK